MKTLLLTLILSLFGTFILIPIFFGIRYLIQIQKQNKLFRDLKPNDRFKGIIYENVFQEPTILWFRITNKKVHQGDKYVQFKQEDSNKLYCMKFEYFIEYYEKVNES